MSAKFTPIEQAYVYGVEAWSDSLRLVVEVVRCYDGEWNVFLTDHGHVIARSIAEYRECANGYTDRATAMRIARGLL